ncbi:peptidoglycan-binding domain-containing protein [Neorhizobium vignae]|uniref:peptidoglycan-binding domain-containing protein n=1 Tax=Neorhizobium vignae TaxID=690585 RepID=UPI000A00E933|nr:peptidoglycan-binding domain-containing protein [Neorhizobium vignae]
MSVSSRGAAAFGLLLGLVCTSVPANANEGDRILSLFGALIDGSGQPQGRGRAPSRQANTESLDSKEMYTAQNRLRELGYDVGQPDGQAGPRTREAIRRFQRDNGFSPDGSLTSAQFHHMMQSSGSSSGESVRAAEIPLSPDEMADMQKSLAKLGFDVGEADGKGGTKTGRAIAKFLSDRGRDPYQTSVQTAYQLVTEAANVTPTDRGETGDQAMTTASNGDRAGTEAGLTTANVAGEYIDWPYGSIHHDADRAALHKEITRRLIGSDPEILDNPAIMERWLEDLGRGYRGVWSPVEIAEAYRRYTGGSEFDKQAAVADFRTFMSGQGVTTSMRVTRVRPAEFGAYDFKSGTFPLRYSDDFGTEMRFSAAGGNWIVVEAPALVVPANLTMSRAKAEALAARFKANGSRSVNMSARMKIVNFKVENDRSGRRTIFAEAVVERIALHEHPKNGENGFGSVIAEIDVKQPEVAEPQAKAPTARNNLESWTRLGFAARDGRVVLPVRREGEVGQAGRAATAFGLLVAGNLPAQPKSLGTVRRLASDFASSDVYRSLFPAGRDDRQFFRDLANDPFRQEEIIKQFNAEVLPQIVADAPKLPVRARVSMPVELQGYDIGKQAFATDPHRLLLPGVVFDSNLRSEFPRMLKVGTQQARGLVERAKRNEGRLKLYYGVEMELTKVSVQMREERLGVFESANMYSTVTGSATSVALFEDSELTRLVVTLPLHDFVPPPKILPGSPAPNGHYLSNWSISAMAIDLAGNPDLPRRLVESARFVTEKNEFERADAVRNGLSRLAASKPDASQPLYLMGEITLGAYDGTEAFQISKSQFAVRLEQDGEQLEPGFINIQVENSDALTRLPFTKAAAEKLVGEYPARVFPALFRVRAIRAETSVNTRPPFARMDLAVDEIMLMDRNQTDRVRFSIPTRSVPTVANGQSVVLERVPERLALNLESTALLLAKYGKITLDDAALRVLLFRRWEEEHSIRTDVINLDAAPWGRFFPQNYRELTDADYVRLLPRFRRWTELRIAALPDKLRYENYYDQSGFDKYFGWPASQYAEAFGEVGIGRREFAGYRGHLFNEQIEQAGTWVTPRTVLSLVQDLKPQARSDVYVPLENLPSPPRDAFARAISLDLDVRGSVVGTSPIDGKPMVILDTMPTEVRWFGDKTAVTPRSMIAKFRIAPIGPRKSVAISTLDIVGVTIGMTQGEAEAAIRKHMAVDRVLELKGDSRNVSVVAESARLYVAADGMDMIGILYGPMVLEPKVYGIARSVFSPLGSVTQDQVLAALTKKYGTSSSTNAWRWGENTDLGVCGDQGTPNNVNWTGATVIEGKPLFARQVTQQQVLEEPALGAELRLLRRVQYLNWGFDIRTNVEGCKPTFTAQFQDSYRVGLAGERIPDADTTLLRSWLFDHAPHYRALKEAQAASKPVMEVIDLKL